MTGEDGRGRGFTGGFRPHRARSPPPRTPRAAGRAAVPLTELQVRRAMECLLLAVSRHHLAGHSARSPGSMLVLEARLLAAWTIEMGLTLAEVEDMILRRVEAALHARYGHEAAPRLYRL